MTKARTVGLTTAGALRLAGGVGVNKLIKKHNKKVNKVRRHIED